MTRSAPLAIALSLTGAFFLTAMDAVAKTLLDVFPVTQISVLRNIFGLFFIFLIFLGETAWRRQQLTFRVRKWRLALFRGVFVTVAQIAFFASLLQLELASAVTIGYAGPFIGTALSVPLLGERVGPWRWVAVAIGFTGVILVIRPGSDVFSVYALLPLLAAFCYSTSIVLMRLFDPDEKHALINIYAQASALVLSAAFMLAVEVPVPFPDFATFMQFMLLGIFGAVGIYCLTMAYRLVPPAVVAPFDYFGVLFALILGWFFFAEWPFDRLFPGVLFIVGGGLVIIWRENRRRARR